MGKIDRLVDVITVDEGRPEGRPSKLIMGATEAGLTQQQRNELMRLTDQLATEANELRDARTDD